MYVVLDYVVPFIFLTSIITCALLITRIPSKRRMHKLFYGSLYIYIYIVVLVLIYDQLLSLWLYSFDLDGNGIFTDDEVTKIQVEVKSLVINDLGRNLLPFTMLVLSPLLYWCALVLRKLLVAFSFIK